MTRAQWRDPNFRARYYQRRRKQIKQRPKPRLGIFAFERGFYRHNGRLVFV